MADGFAADAKAVGMALAPGAVAEAGGAPGGEVTVPAVEATVLQVARAKRPAVAAQRPGISVVGILVGGGRRSSSTVRVRL